MNIIIKRSELLAKLKDRLEAAKRFDAAEEAKVERKKELALIGFRKRLKEALKFDYQKASTCGNYRGFDLSFRTPDAHRPQAEFINRVIQRVQHCSVDRFVINNGSEDERALLWQPPVQDRRDE